jgi:hypothetical protein
LVSVFAQSQLSPLSTLFFTLMEDRFAIGFFGEQNMKDDTSDLVRGGRDGGGRAQLRAHTTKELAEITFCSTKRMRT